MERLEAMLRDLGAAFADEGLLPDLDELRNRLHNSVPTDAHALRRDTDALVARVRRILTSCGGYQLGDEDDGPSYAERLILGSQRDGNAPVEPPHRAASYVSPALQQPVTAPRTVGWAGEQPTIVDATVVSTSKSVKGALRDADTSQPMAHQPPPSYVCSEPGPPSPRQPTSSSAAHATVEEAAAAEDVLAAASSAQSDEGEGEEAVEAPGGREEGSPGASEPIGAGAAPSTVDLDQPAWGTTSEDIADGSPWAATVESADDPETLMREAAKMEDEGRLVEASALMARALSASRSE